MFECHNGKWKALRDIEQFHSDLTSLLEALKDIPACKLAPEKPGKLPGGGTHASSICWTNDCISAARLYNLRPVDFSRSRRAAVVLDVWRRLLVIIVQTGPKRRHLRIASVGGDRLTFASCRQSTFSIDTCASISPTLSHGRRSTPHAQPLQCIEETNTCLSLAATGQDEIKLGRSTGC